MDSTEAVPLTAEEWAARRLGVALRWTEVARFYGKPASTYEVTAAVMADAAITREDGLRESPLYDRRALLNVIAVLLDAARTADPGDPGAGCCTKRLRGCVTCGLPDDGPDALEDTDG